MIFIIFALLAGSAFCEKPTPPGFHWIPTLEGKFHLVHESEVKDTEGAVLKYNPYEDVGFRLFTNKNKRETELIEIDNAQALKESSFDSSLDSRFMVHGWGDNGVDGGAVHFMKEAYLDKADYNYFAVDWSKGSDTANYVSARKRANKTGIVIGQFIEFLVREGGVKLDTIRIAGFSLGGQVIGYAGKHLKGQLPAIYGIDPAGPLFFENSNDRLTFEDAKYVEVIHTNGLKLGYDKPTGHIDFYPNNGRSQPGCPKWLDVAGSCSHSRALYYFAESISNDKGFIGVRCNSRDEITSKGCSNSDGGERLLGGDPKVVPIVKERQVFWLKTNKKSPFALGQSGTE